MVSTFDKWEDSILALNPTAYQFRRGLETTYSNLKGILVIEFSFELVFILKADFFKILNMYYSIEHALDLDWLPKGHSNISISYNN